MQKSFQTYIFLILFVFSAALSCKAAEPVTIETLLQEMVDRSELARLDSPSYKCRQFSSYDRNSKSPDSEGWYANGDFNQFIRTEERDGRVEDVMMDADGPGAVVRFWLTMSGEGSGRGTLRIYLDGSDTPTIEGNVFDLVSRGMIAGEPLSQSVSPQTNELQRGHNLYFPIPYAESCKITFEREAEGSFYYQINYRTYPEGTEVETYSAQAKEDAADEIALVRDKLSHNYRGAVESWETVSMNGELSSGESKSVTVSGPAAIRKILLDIDADDLEQALRSTVLQIEFDGTETVWAPVGDFFGTGHQLHPYSSWYTQVSEDGTMECYWVMPYQTQAKVTVRNLGEQTVDIQSSGVYTDSWNWDGRSMYFHSRWKQLYKAETIGAYGYDVNFVTVNGEGKYVGDTLTIFNGGTAWWGEGDEKIFVDGESFPSHFGTGTEDYYGYAWCRPERFEAPFHAQPSGSGNLSPGFTVNSRWRALDAIPFDSSIKMDMELWHWETTKVNYAPTTFWYARPGATSNVSPAPEEAKRPVAKEREDIVDIFRVKGAIEGESLEIESITGGVTEIQTLGNEWSSEKHLWWRDADIGSKLILNLPCEKAGEYIVKAGLTYAFDYGIVTIRLNGEVLKSNLNVYDPDLQRREITLGTAELKEGDNLLEIEITGSDPDAVKRHMFGLDYIKYSDISITARATKICQLIGDRDKERDEWTLNKTGQRYGLYGTDLGVPFSHNGRTYILFGDDPYNGDRDPIAYTQDTDLEDCLRLRLLRDPDNLESYNPIEIPGISLAAFEVPTEGVSVNGKMYIYVTTDHNPPTVMGRSVMAVSEDDGYNFSYLYDFSTQHFINISIVKVEQSEWRDLPPPSDEGKGLVIFGSGEYRASNVRLAFQPASQIESPSSRRYFSGLTSSGQPMWSSDESDAEALFDQPTVGELSVSYNKFIRKWIMLYNSTQPRGINMRIADKPWGPWSEPQVIFQPWEDDGYCHFMHVSWNLQQCDSVHDDGRENDMGGEYGPYQFEDLATGDSCSTTIYFTMSTWNPYTVVLMKAVLGRTYQECELSDYIKDGFVDISDLAKFAQYWVTADSRGDIAPGCGDEVIDYTDLRDFSACWLK